MLTEHKAPEDGSSSLFVQNIPDDIDVPLCVDMDGTLLKVDTLQEAGLSALSRNWVLWFQLPGLLARGKAVFKRALAEQGRIAPASLPCNEDFLALLKQEYARGRRLILATAADRVIAKAIADHFGIFSEVIASDGKNNLRGKAKADILCQRFGERGFIYAGNDEADYPVWSRARTAIVVNAKDAVARKAQTICASTIVFSRRAGMARAALKALRPYQWVKNVLVFVPIITAHAMGDARAWLNAMALLIAFSAAASSIYIVNDLLDLNVDRQHSRKRRRPFASGTLPLAAGILLAPALFIIALFLGLWGGFLYVVLLYGLLSTSYSIKLKEMPLVDIFMLAALYTIRLFGGGVVTGHHLSLWLLAFSSFLFLSLALVKRVEELMEISRMQGGTTLRRGYYTSDVGILQVFGCASAFASCIVLALFVQNEAVGGSYVLPELLWGLVPLMLFWQCRLWLSTARGYMHDDPILYAARDWVSWLVAIIMVAIMTLASLESTARIVRSIMT